VGVSYVGLVGHDVQARHGLGHTILGLVLAFQLDHLWLTKYSSDGLSYLREVVLPICRKKERDDPSTPATQRG